ncbi:hypothetical protein ACSF6V_09930 [Escherichia coli]
MCHRHCTISEYVSYTCSIAFPSWWSGWLGLPMHSYLFLWKMEVI